MPTLTTGTEKLALLGGPRTIETVNDELFRWPIVTEEDERAVLEVLRAGNMSNIDVTKQFEVEFAEWMGVKHALASCNGTSSLLEAMFGVGLGRGDEMIVPSVTYWASALQCMTLGATPVFADIDPFTLAIDPGDIEHRITSRTRAIMVVHYCGYPCEMDAILAIANKHGLKVIEDVSHAHGGKYKGRMVGTLGHVSAMSMMSSKGFAIGEGGMLCTDDREIYERAIAFGHYEQHSALTLPDLKELAGLPLGAIKGRLNQCCAAMGRVQLRHYEKRMREVQDALNWFWDELEGVPGIRPHRTNPESESTMGGWYNPIGHYVPEELGGLSIQKFTEAVAAEGAKIFRGANLPLHVHPVLNQADVFHDGKPTRVAFAACDVRQPRGSLPTSENLAARSFGAPSFKKCRPDEIRPYAAAFAKVARQADKLL